MVKLKCFLLFHLINADCSTKQAPNTTIGGYTCQRWDKGSPHRPELRPVYRKHNFCASLNGTEQPYCYTTDPKKEWDFCKVEKCECEWNCINGKGATYNGTVSTTKSGKQCKRWDSLPDYKLKPLFTNHNFCRNPYGQRIGPWCYTDDPKRPTEQCGIPQCAKNQHPCGNTSIITTKTEQNNKTSTAQVNNTISIQNKAPVIETRSCSSCGVNFKTFDIPKNDPKVTKHDIRGGYMEFGKVQSSDSFPSCTEKYKNFILGGQKTRKGLLPHQVAVRYKDNRS